MRDTIVLDEGGFLIVESIRPFGTGYNCYKGDGDKYSKINPLSSWFATIDAAKEWLEEQIRGNVP